MNAAAPIRPVSRLDAALCIGVFLVALVSHACLSLVGLKNRPIDGHEFRQTQTAIAIRYLSEEGLSINYPTPVLGKPWSIPLEFPLYQWSAVMFARVTGMDLEPAARLTGLLYFYATLPAIFLLARALGFGRARALLALSCVLSCPLYLFYPRTVMIESTALCFSAWFLWLFWRYCAAGGLPALIAAIVCGALAAVVKLTTVAVFLVPAALVAYATVWKHRAVARRPLALAVVALAMVTAAGLLWSRYADGVKAQNPLASFLASGAIGPWAFGTIAQRFSAPFWGTFSALIATTAHFGALLIGLVFVAQSSSARWKAALVLVGCFAVGPFVFSTLYQIHDYYYFASAVFLLVALAIGLSQLADTVAIPLAVRWVTIAAVLAGGFFNYWRTYRTLVGPNDYRVPEMAHVLAAATAPGDVVVILGHDWNPFHAYLAGRRALMIPDHTEARAEAIEQAVKNLEGESVGALVVIGSTPRRATLAANLAVRFGLTPEPAARSNEAAIHVPRAKATDAVANWSGMTLREFTVKAPSGRVKVSGIPAAERQHLRMFSPEPTELNTPFGLSSGELPDGPFFNAHAPAEVLLPVPAGAKRFKASFGVLEGEAIESPKGTDGVVFEALLVDPNGMARPLAKLLLSPRFNAADRGTKSWDVALPPGFTGNILLRTDPGPNGDASFDWAFWGRVVVE